jgi:hypothetical protein
VTVFAGFAPPRVPRFHAITAGVAMAFVAGLSAPAVAAAADNPVSAVNTAAETSVGALGDAGGTTEMSKTEAIAASAIAKLTGETPASAAAAKGSDTATPAQKHTAKKPAQKSAKKATAPTKKQPTRGIRRQESYKPSNERQRTAETVKAGQKMNRRAQVIAVATAMQESTLKPGYLGDRNTTTPRSVPAAPVVRLGHASRSPTCSTRDLFYWAWSMGAGGMPLTGAAQAVQVSAFLTTTPVGEGARVASRSRRGPYAASRGAEVTVTAI